MIKTYREVVKKYLKAWLITTVFLGLAMKFGYKGFSHGGVSLTQLYDGLPWFLVLTGGIAGCYVYSTRICDWNEYWEMYDKLIVELKNENKVSIANKLIEARTFVNGLTDGWFEFKEKLDEVIESNRGNLTSTQKNILHNLSSTLKYVLKRRW